MPYDSSGYPVESYYREDGMYIMNKAEKEAAQKEEERLWQGGDVDINLSKEEIADLWGDLLNS